MKQVYTHYWLTLPVGDLFRSPCLGGNLLKSPKNPGDDHGCNWSVFWWGDWLRWSCSDPLVHIQPSSVDCWVHLYQSQTRVSSRESAARRVHWQYSTSISEVMLSRTMSKSDNVPVEIICGLRGGGGGGGGVTQTMSDSDNESDNIWARQCPNWNFLWGCVWGNSDNVRLGQCPSWNFSVGWGWG